MTASEALRLGMAAHEGVPTLLERELVLVQTLRRFARTSGHVGLVVDRRA